MNLDELVASIMARSRPLRLVAVDGPSGALAEWHTIEPAPIVITEGVSAGRSEWAAHLSFLIWIETPRGERLRRGVEGDGIAALDDRESWMAGEEAGVALPPGHYRAPHRPSRPPNETGSRERDWHDHYGDPRRTPPRRVALDRQPSARNGSHHAAMIAA